MNNIDGNIYIGTISDEFMVTSIGAVGLINVFKNISLGVGGSYRNVRPLKTTIVDPLNAYSVQLLLRLKIGSESDEE
ncbi:MAG: hypothetical protein GC193_13855 [Cryomorphaceae bacterium]|nr:hypothetical protein [Cryomorphaceae bacterium]